MAWYTAVFLGIVQGLAEFLPISSSGHLLLFETWFGLTDGGLLFNIVLHLATLLAVVVVYWRPIVVLIKHPWQPLTGQLLLATGLTCTVVVVFKSTLDQLFSYQTLPALFMLCGVILWLPLMIKKRPRANGWWSAVAMGLAQGAAVVPGLSRSGCTITAGQITGLPKDQAADFSFLMSLPIIVASLVYELMAGATMVPVGLGNLVLAFVSAFGTGVLALKLLLDLLRRLDLRGFAVYLLLLGGVLGLHVWFQVF